ncbi:MULTISPECIES: SGNH/GDSL hydrolase family protein [unclassified Pseudoalteromonas]|uniref:SGNH/GDSL hydrolase family protein n=1 Tax=unclassified Pseudoalteromonas TaxID=194690 RepID=UPI00131A3082|nr:MULTISPECIES: GDSL-type esterase/lipase family protein [unclassified Pseudoalteromonas]MBS3797850.1 peptidase [Pseudoalteromonas sp. BDTF-M6]
MTHILCFGDSITRGENDAAAGGWVDRLKAREICRFVTGSRAETCVFNMGIGGETSDGLVQRFANELAPRMASPQRTFVTLAYGANDVAITAQQRSVPLARFISNLHICIEHALDMGVQPILINILPVAQCLDGVTNNLGKRRLNTDIASYNQALAQLAEETSVPLIDVAALFSNSRGGFGLLTADGVHPNSAGHRLLFECIDSHLEKITQGEPVALVDMQL